MNINEGYVNCALRFDGKKLRTMTKSSPVYSKWAWATKILHVHIRLDCIHSVWKRYTGINIIIVHEAMFCSFRPLEKCVGASLLTVGTLGFAILLGCK
jgi:hypothetical protein